MHTYLLGAVITLSVQLLTGALMWIILVICAHIFTGGCNNLLCSYFDSCIDMDSSGYTYTDIYWGL